MCLDPFIIFVRSKENLDYYQSYPTSSQFNDNTYFDSLSQRLTSLANHAPQFFFNQQTWPKELFEWVVILCNQLREDSNSTSLESRVKSSGARKLHNWCISTMTVLRCLLKSKESTQFKAVNKLHRLTAFLSMYCTSSSNTEKQKNLVWYVAHWKSLVYY